jgi:hypothetical protein
MCSIDFMDAIDRLPAHLDRFTVRGTAFDFASGLSYLCRFDKHARSAISGRDFMTRNGRNALLARLSEWIPADLCHA